MSQGEYPTISTPAPQAVVLDIEGTICPISFVHETLFPYALNALPSVCEKKWSDAEFQTYVAAFPPEAQQSPQALIEHVRDLTARDIKVASLKNLQGYLWKDGYESAAYTTPLFPDVVPFLTACSKRQPAVKLAIYSSGSVAAQKLFSTYVQKPDGSGTVDIKPLMSDFFDTTNAGPKLESPSYEHIVKQLAFNSEEIQFFTDNIKEAEASEAAHMDPFLVVRPGNAPLTEEQKQRWASRGRLITSFDQLQYK